MALKFKREAGAASSEIVPRAASNVNREQMNVEARRVGDHINALHDEIDALTHERNDLGAKLQQALLHNQQLMSDNTRLQRERDEYQTRWTRVDENLRMIAEAIVHAVKAPDRYRPPEVDMEQLSRAVGQIKGEPIEDDGRTVPKFLLQQKEKPE